MFGCFFEDREKYIPLKKAPQNMCYVYDKDGNKYVLISVHPEWLAMILNGLKTIEVRRKVLKEVL
jgi:predicted transcriptional regulator